MVVANVPVHLQDELPLGLQVVQQQVGPLVVLPQLEKQAAKVVQDELLNVKSMIFSHIPKLHRKKIHHPVL